MIFFVDFFDFLRRSSVFAVFRRFSLKLRPADWDGGPGTATPFDGLNTLSVAARGSTPPRFSPQVPLIQSHRTRAEGHAAETTTTTTTTTRTRWRCAEAPVPPSRPGQFG